jgi:hypothetical protein
MTLLSRISRDFAGIVYAVDRSTGAIRELPEARFNELERAGLLGADLVRLSRAHAEATAAMIRGKIQGRN